MWVYAYYFVDIEKYPSESIEQKEYGLNPQNYFILDDTAPK